jgi:hypothetical protein
MAITLEGNDEREKNVSGTGLQISPFLDRYT